MMLEEKEAGDDSINTLLEISGINQELMSLQGGLSLTAEQETPINDSSVAQQ
jgi:hypothetical protein